jgi:hypothetical protein
MDSSMTDTTAADTTTGGEGPCGDPTMAAAPCGADCAFDPTTLDCMAACQNVADQCATTECSASDSCVGQNQDVALCVAACEGSKALTCPNIVLGCWATAGAMNCEDVGVCVQDNS